MNIFVCLIGYILSEEVFECNCNIYSKECEEYCPFTKSSYVNLVKQKSNLLISFEDKVYNSCKLRDWFNTVNYINIIRDIDKRLYNYLKYNPKIFNKCIKKEENIVNNNLNVINRGRNIKFDNEKRNSTTKKLDNIKILQNSQGRSEKNIPYKNNQNNNLVYDSQNKKLKYNSKNNISIINSNPNLIYDSQNKKPIINQIKNNLSQDDNAIKSVIYNQYNLNNRQIDLPDNDINLLVTKKYTPYFVDNNTTINSDIINPINLYEKEKFKPSNLQISVITKTSTVHSTTIKKIAKKINDKNDFLNDTQNNNFTELLKEIKKLKNTQTITNTILKRELITTTKNFFIWDDTNPSTVISTTTIYKINNQNNLSGSTIHITKTEYITKTYTSSLRYTTFTITSTSTEFTTLKRITTDQINNRIENNKILKEDIKISSSINLPYKNKEDKSNDIANNRLLINDDENSNRTDKNISKIEKFNTGMINYNINTEFSDFSIIKDNQPYTFVNKNHNDTSNTKSSTIPNIIISSNKSKVNSSTVSDFNNNVLTEINSSITVNNGAIISNHDESSILDKHSTKLSDQNSTISSDQNSTISSDNISTISSDQNSTISSDLERSTKLDNISTVNQDDINLSSLSTCTNNNNKLIIKIKKKIQSTKTETITSNYTLSPEVIYKTVTEYVYTNLDSKKFKKLPSSTVNIKEKDITNTTNSIIPSSNLERFKTVVTSYLYIS